MELGQFALNKLGTNIEISALFRLMAEVEMDHFSHLQLSGVLAQNYSIHEQKIIL